MPSKADLRHVDGYALRLRGVSTVVEAGVQAGTTGTGECDGKRVQGPVVGLDIGTAKVMVVVAEFLPGGELKLAGLGVTPSTGLKRGVVVNIDATVQSIQQALKEAELMADCKITPRLHRHHRQPHPRHQLQRHGGREGPRSHRRPMWPAWLRRPRPSTSPPTSGCSWLSRRSSSSTARTCASPSA
jgi:hypothetical protein